MPIEGTKSTTKIAANNAGDATLSETLRVGLDSKQAEVRITKPHNQDVQRDKLGQESVSVFLSLDDMDEFAIAWCKHRKLQGALGGPIGNEWGSPDCPYE